MKALKSNISLLVLVLSFVFTNSVLATEPVTNESKDDGAGDTISNVDLTNDANSDTATVDAQDITADSEQQAEQPETISDSQSYRKEMDLRRLQVQKEQQEAYERFLERRKQFFANNPEYNSNTPADVQARRDEFIKQMEERRALHVKMMEEHRKAAEERRKAMQLKMHQTETAPEVPTKV